jgi:hypothetical protein
MGLLALLADIFKDNASLEDFIWKIVLLDHLPVGHVGNFLMYDSKGV